jgi:Domain of unknown function (DUF4440)
MKDPEAAIRAVHDADRIAHLRGDPGALAVNCGPRMLSVSNGAISIQTPEEVRARFEAYFRGITHTTWEDVESPIIRVSDSGDLAYAIYRVHSHYTPNTTPSDREETDFISAWIATYELIDGTWKLTSVASTFEVRRE